MKTEKEKQTRSSLYKTIWRWHFYAGLLIAPFLIILAFTGSIYLYKPQIEHFLYKDLYEVTAQEERISPTTQIEEVKKEYPHAVVTTYRPGEAENRSSEIGITNHEESLTIFSDPYTGNIIGELNNEDRIMDKIEEFHGELMAGTIGDRFVELVACWAVILVITGFYLWMPKKKFMLSGSLFPRFKKGKKILVRDMHAVPAFWIMGGMLFLILTGLPWSGFWGGHFQNFATQTGVGYPPSIYFGNAPESTIKTKEIADVPWAAENLEIPSSEVGGFIPISIDDVVRVADREGIDPSYTIYLPSDPAGVYTLSAYPPKAQDELTMHVDQYTGAVLTDYRFENYGFIGKIVALGVTIHKGTQFGWINQLISLIICWGIIFVAFSGYYLWLIRKKKHDLSAPNAPSSRKVKGFLILLIILGIIFPLVGLSLILVWLIDLLIIQRTPKLKQFFNA
ncbi:PepSY domain-containing protein [Bacillus sp. UMB0899]|nr:PepSY domain-containing protein [Bacillus sp. UMB0899]